MKKPESKINIINHENEQMLMELKNRELDIIFSKKIKVKDDDKNIKFIKLGNWNDVLITSENSKWKNNKITLNDIKNATVYMPKKTSETTYNFLDSINCKYEDLKDIKHITYKTITDIIKNSDVIGLVTEEFVTQEIRKNNLCILDTEFKINPIEFGIYVNNDNKFKDLKELIQIIKAKFMNDKK